jgi:hypothetical protein
MVTLDKVKTAEEQKEEEIQELHTLPIHGLMDIPTGGSVLRVPGGWIYHYSNSSVFVPYNDEGCIYEDEDWEEEY